MRMMLLNCLIEDGNQAGIRLLVTFGHCHQHSQKQKLIEATNIETSADEMAVLDSILFRFWQMGWLDKLDSSEIIHCRDCEKYGTKYCEMDTWTDQVMIRRVKPDDFCSKAEKREE